MQSNKTSKKKSSSAEKTSAPTAAEEVLAASAPAAKRATRSSKKKSDLTDMASVKHSHKLSSSVVSSPAPAAKPLNDTPSRSVHHREIAELAYYYWADRGFRDGDAEGDWLRAEKALSASAR
jgi:hypothetical protein